jgi:hypothetical protein
MDADVQMDGITATKLIHSMLWDNPIHKVQITIAITANAIPGRYSKMLDEIRYDD